MTLHKRETFLNQSTGDLFPAATLQVMQSGETVLARAVGWLDPETRQHPTQIDSLFDLSSLTKLFTTIAFMTFVEDGVLSLHTPVIAVLPELSGLHPICPSMDPLTRATIPSDAQWADGVVDADDVTFFHLLTHTSGLAAWRPLFEFEAGAQSIAFSRSGKRTTARPARRPDLGWNQLCIPTRQTISL